MERVSKKVYLVSALAVILWGMSYIWTDRLIEAGISVMYFVPVRILLAGLLLLLVNAVSGRLRGIERKDIPQFLLLAFFEPLIYFLAESYGIQETGSPTLSAMVIATIPIFSIFAGHLLFRERISLLNVAGIFLSMGGICLVVMCKGRPGPNFIFGIVLLLIAVFSEVGHASVTKKLAGKYDSMVIVMYQFLIGSVYLMPLFFTFGLKDFGAHYLVIDTVVPILCLAILCSSLAFSLWVNTIKHLGVSKSGIFTALIPVASAVVAWAIGHETLLFHQWAGIAVSTVGVILSQYNGKRKR